MYTYICTDIHVRLPETFPPTTHIHGLKEEGGQQSVELTTPVRLAPQPPPASPEPSPLGSNWSTLSEDVSSCLDTLVDQKIIKAHVATQFKNKPQRKNMIIHAAEAVLKTTTEAQLELLREDETRFEEDFLKPAKEHADDGSGSSSWGSSSVNMRVTMSIIDSLLAGKNSTQSPYTAEATQLEMLQGLKRDIAQLLQRGDLARG